MPTCSFCKKNFEAPRGLTVFTFEGKTIHFCSTKCRRNMDLKRDPKKVNWVKRVKKEKGGNVEKIEIKKSEKVVEDKKVKIKGEEIKEGKAEEKVEKKWLN